MHANPLQSLTAFGQSVWVDFLSRDLLDSGEFMRLLREDGVTGVTTNPSIFEKAVSGSDIYDQRIVSLSGSGLSATEIVRSLNAADVITAADLLKPVYQHSGGQDGFVSIEVSPHHANNPPATLRAARRLWKSIDRPNVLIKIPATRTCLPTIRQLLVEGININVTLLFGVGRYGEVAETYLQAME
ncbi:MAG TPA: transaldolase family protein, partial [Gammaproteobacteria bacterium]